MEKISDFLSAIKERITSPLIYSYLISWSVVNWDTTVAILFLSDKEIQNEGYASLLELIQNNDINNWLPIVFAIIYTIASPIVRNCIDALHAWAIGWGDRWTLSLQKKTGIPMDKYLALKEHLENRTEELDKIIRDEQNKIDKVSKLETALKKEQVEHITSKTTIEELRKRNRDNQTQITNLQSTTDALLEKVRSTFDIQFMVGNWIMETILLDGKDHQKTKITIHADGRITRIDETEPLFEIDHFIYQEETKTIFFVKYALSTAGGGLYTRLYHVINDLYFNVDRGIVVEGLENQIKKIKYTKM